MMSRFGKIVDFVSDWCENRDNFVEYIQGQEELGIVIAPVYSQFFEVKKSEYLIVANMSHLMVSLIDYILF